MSTEWYYAKDNEQLGPIAPSQLKILASSGQLSPDDLVWKEGMPEWQPAGKIKGLFAPGTTPAAAAPVAAARAAQYPVPQQQHGGAPPQSSIGYYNPTGGLGARTANILRGMPRPTGPQNDWPLSDHHLEQLKKAEEHRKPIRACASLLNLLFVLYLIASIIIVLAGVFTMNFAPGGRNTAYAAGFMVGLGAAVVGLTVLAFFASRATTKCKMWGAITFLVLFCLGILLNLVGMFMTMSTSTSGGGAEVFGAVISIILPAVFAFVCLKAVIAIPKFLASPVWCQEALVNAKL
jgi:hypothetical protein